MSKSHHDYQTIASEWNINQGFFNHLVEIIIKIDEASEQGDEVLWFNRCRLLFRNTSGLLKETKRKGVSCLSAKDLDDLFTEIRNMFPKRRPESEAEFQMLKLQREDILAKLDVLNRELINAMHLNNLILPMNTSDPAMAGLNI